MKTGILLCLLIGIMLPSLVPAQTTQTTSPSRYPASDHPPAKDAYIVGFHVETEGALHIIYSDGSQVEIPKERGRFGDPEQPLTQDNFLDIQLADDRRHLGWLADYMMCQQSYPCPMELVIYQSGHKLRYISPPEGIMWRWTFLKGGEQVAVEYGFPHGDVTGACALYDTDTGRELTKFSSKKKKAPNWVEQLRRSNR